MKKERLEAGRIVSTHGIHGEVRVEVWADGPEFFTKLYRVFIDGTQVKLLRARPHKHLVILKLAGIDDVDAAMAMKGKILFIDRGDVDTQGRFFVQDLLGLPVTDEQTGEVIGELSEVLNMPANDIYVVKNESGREYMIPAVPEFIKYTDPEKGITVHLIEGL